MRRISKARSRGRFAKKFYDLPKANLSHKANKFASQNVLTAILHELFMPLMAACLEVCREERKYGGIGIEGFG